MFSAFCCFCLNASSHRYLLVNGTRHAYAYYNTFMAGSKPLIAPGNCRKYIPAGSGGESGRYFLCVCCRFCSSTAGGRLSAFRCHLNGNKRKTVRCNSCSFCSHRFQVHNSPHHSNDGLCIQAQSQIPTFHGTLVRVLFLFWTVLPLKFPRAGGSDLCSKSSQVTFLSFQY